MAAVKINGVKLKQAIEKFGSLEEAIEDLENKKEVLEKESSKLRKANEELKLAKDKLTADIDELTNEYSEHKKKLQSLGDNFGKWERQYNLFQDFIAMLLGSPSVDTSLKNLISLLQELSESGWVITKNTDELRSYFVSTIMGDYLKSFHCKVCGAKFVVNRKPYYQSISNYYQCPACHASFGVEPDDTFLKVMVSEEQMENIILVEETLKENKALEPLKAFLDVPCEICGQPINEWTEDNVKAVMSGYGWAHTKCWNGDVGKLKLFLILQKQVQAK